MDERNDFGHGIGEDLARAEMREDLTDALLDMKRREYLFILICPFV